MKNSRKELYQKLISFGYEFTNIRDLKYGNSLDKQILYSDLWILEKTEQVGKSEQLEHIHIRIWFNYKTIKKYFVYSNCREAMCPEEEIYKEINVPFTKEEKEIIKIWGWFDE